MCKLVPKKISLILINVLNRHASAVTNDYHEKNAWVFLLHNKNVAANIFSVENIIPEVIS